MSKQLAVGSWQSADRTHYAARSTTLLVFFLALSALLLIPTIAFADPPPEHQYIEEYEGAQTCEKCHLGVADQVMHSVHYTWSEKMEHYTPLTATIPKINWLGVLNPEMEIAGGCGRCHIGGGAMPGTPAGDSPEAAGEIDCLVCHAEVYDMKARYPQQNEEGEWQIIGDRSLAAARSAARPSDEACLRCHLNAGGGTLFKRGVDFAPVADRHAAESYGDIHAERGMVCVDCHRAPDHQIYGFGPTLWSRDRADERLACADCHTDDPHDNALLNQHDRLDCRSCHVRDTGGLMARDWTAEPVYDPITELYGPVDELAPPNSTPPSHLWHNGERWLPDQGWPGEYSDLDSRIQPFKVFEGTAPVNPNNGRPWPLLLSVFYKTGDLEKAMEMGAQEANIIWTGEWQPQTMSAPLQISHGIVEAERALTCEDCHVPEGRMDFAALGYSPDRVAILESLSSPTSGEGQMLQVDFTVDGAVPFDSALSEMQEVSGPASVPGLSAWSWIVAVMIITFVFAVVVFLLWRLRDRLAA